MVGKTAMGFLTMQDIARMGEKGIFEYASRTNIENWYEILKEHSIPTAVIPLDKESMLAIVHAIDDANRAKAPPDMTPSVIVGLITSIDTVIRSLGSAFVRLSTRSPKDSTIAIQKGKSRYQAEIEGAFHDGETVVMLDDLATTGESKFEAIDRLKSAGLVTHDVVVLIDRQGGARQGLEARGVRLHAVFTMTELLDHWQATRRLDAETLRAAREFLGSP